jgi:putative transposase
MRLSASEKLEIIGLVEQSHLPARRTLQMLGIKPSTFYRWYDRFRSGGLEALEDKPSKPDRVWNRIPDDIRQRVVMMAFEQPELSPRELATRFTDTNGTVRNSVCEAIMMKGKGASYGYRERPAGPTFSWA